MPTKIYLLRHGQALHNLTMPNYDKNDEIYRDAALTEEGYTQTLELKSQINGIRFDAIYCSPLQRCRQTLKLAYPRSVYLPVELDDRLLEQPYGTHISNRRQEKGELISCVPISWSTTRVADENPHVLRSKKAEYKLIRDFIGEILKVHPYESVLVVCHGKWINRFLKTYCRVSKWVKNCECLEVTLTEIPVEKEEEQNMMVQDEEVEEGPPKLKRFKSE
jgi:broad specificity phosphatase PhoE